MAPVLSHKALHPSNLERENMRLVLKIFDEKTITAVDTFDNNTDTDMSGTSKFLSIILRLWKVLNVKSTGRPKGRRRRDANMSYTNPIRGIFYEYVNNRLDSKSGVSPLCGPGGKLHVVTNDYSKAELFNRFLLQLELLTMEKCHQ